MVKFMTKKVMRKPLMIPKPKGFRRLQRPTRRTPMMIPRLWRRPKKLWRRPKLTWLTIAMMTLACQKK